MEDLSKKTNNELTTLKVDLSVDFDAVKQEIVRLYDHWQNVESNYNKVNSELRKRGIV